MPPHYQGGLLRRKDGATRTHDGWGQAMAADAGREKGRTAEVFGAFLRLGLTSFGGPIAHLGYFRQEFVARRGWLSDAAYAELVALCQFLPGPASSQLGFALGLMRAGWRGALAAFVAFTLPSALALMLLAALGGALDSPLWRGAMGGLGLLAVAVVAQALIGMARGLCPDAPRATIAAGALGMLAVAPGAVGMVGAIMLGALAGMALPARATDAPAAIPAMPVGPRGGLVALGVLGAALLLLPALAAAWPGLALADAVFRAGAFVFGGGHVVLPLLETAVVAPGWVAPEDFVAGYGAAQAVPGPLFSVAAHVGFVQQGAPNGVAGAFVALIAIFAPGFLILSAALPFWSRIGTLGAARRAVQGANAAVVGILGAALHDPLLTGSVRGGLDLAVAAGLFVMLTLWRVPLPLVALVAAGAGALRASLA
jgi:chromate transporter